MDSGGKKRILVVGGSGFLGQHLLHELDTACGNMPPYDVAFAHHRPAPPPELLGSLSLEFLCIWSDLRSGECFECSSDELCQPHVIINCAALSIPRACEVDPAAAMDINVPTSLIDWLSSFRDDSILLIHLSTDQGAAIRTISEVLVENPERDGVGASISNMNCGITVYEGVKSFYKEEDETAPVNMYGKSKVAAEKFISENCSNFVILRCSIIYGPQTISPVTKSLPIQWINSVLSCGKEVEFFHDEFRCPVYVKDVVSVISTLTKNVIEIDGNQMKLVLNVGGPDRLSRAQMAEAVADYRGYDCSLIKPVSASSINRGVASPADISMDVSRLVRLLGINPISFKDGVRFTLENCSWPL
ncbi:hypothetical protein KSP40_PGU012977 [Platanthera guangdongensis]|uniref:Methionine adenosyltransferase 2 subunit beta n=1 Tax=Platanthera guangdongensis TaxID=2320717 RepID=A0ABR2MG94_9ASPA